MAGPIVRIVAMADTHLFHERIAVPDGDVLIHAGDMCRGGSLVELATAARWLGSLPHSRKIVVAGNHEIAIEREPAAARAIMRDAGLTYLQDDAAVIAGLAVYGMPWHPACGAWAFGLQRGAHLDAACAQIPAGLDVLITHGPPRGIGDRVYSHVGKAQIHEHAGCLDLLKHVAERPPHLHIFGHIHSDAGTWRAGVTRYVNATTADGWVPPTVIDYQLGANARGIRARCSRGVPSERLDFQGEPPRCHLITGQNRCGKPGAKP